MTNLKLGIMEQQGDCIQGKIIPVFVQQGLEQFLYAVGTDELEFLFLEALLLFLILVGLADKGFQLSAQLGIVKLQGSSHDSIDSSVESVTISQDAPQVDRTGWQLV